MSISVVFDKIRGTPVFYCSVLEFMAASTQCSYSTKSNTHRMEPTWATSLCRLYSPKGSWEALFNLPVFCPVEMTACFYTYWLKNLHPHLTTVPTKPDFQTFTQNLGLPEEQKQNLSLYSDPAKGKVCRTTFNEMKETHFDEKYNNYIPWIFHTDASSSLSASEKNLFHRRDISVNP